MIRKKFVFLFIVLLTAITPVKAEEAFYKLGVVAPLSGPLEQYGTWARRGIEIAVDEINKAGGVNGKRIKLFIEDDSCIPKNAVTALRKLQNIEDIKLYLVFCTAVAVPVAKMTSDNSVVITSSFKTIPLAEGHYTHYFSLQPEILAETRTLVKYLQERKVKKLAILTELDDFCNSYADTLVDLLKRTDIQIVEDERVQRDHIDLKTQLTKIRNSGAEVIYFVFKPHQYSALLKQHAELQMPTKLVSNWVAQTPIALDFPAESTDGIVYTYHYDENESKSSKDFNAKYRELFTESTQVTSASMYDAVYIYKNALEKCGTDKDHDCIKTAISDLSEIKGASGNFKFKDFSTTKDIFLKTIKNRKFQNLN